MADKFRSNEMVGRELEFQEGYALAFGYVVVEQKSRIIWVIKVGVNMPMALCLDKRDAIRVAYALARTYPDGAS